MYPIKNKVVLITGASSGIGAACANQLAEAGCSLILLARRKERIEQLAEKLKADYQIEVLTAQVDVRDVNQVQHFIKNLSDKWRAIDILINNAGLALTTDKFQEATYTNWDIMIDTNMKGLLYVTQAVLPFMIERDSGHIINIGSIASLECYPTGNVYAATKHAVNAISKSMRLDLLGTKIRVTEIDPGAVETEFSEVRWQDKQRAKAYYQDFDPLVPADVADAIFYCVTRPLHVNVAEIVIMPLAQASANHFHRGGKM